MRSNSLLKIWISPISRNLHFLIVCWQMIANREEVHRTGHNSFRFIQMVNASSKTVPFHFSPALHQGTGTKGHFSKKCLRTKNVPPTSRSVLSSKSVKYPVFELDLISYNYFLKIEKLEVATVVEVELTLQSELVTAKWACKDRTLWWSPIVFKVSVLSQRHYCVHGSLEEWKQQYK